MSEHAPTPTIPIEVLAAGRSSNGTVVDVREARRVRRRRTSPAPC